MFGICFKNCGVERLHDPLRATEPFYTGAFRHAQKLDIILIIKVGNLCFYID